MISLDITYNTPEIWVLGVDPDDFSSLQQTPLMSEVKVYNTKGITSSKGFLSIQTTSGTHIFNLMTSDKTTNQLDLPLGEI